MFPEKLISSLRALLLPHHSNKQQPLLRMKSLYSALLETYYAKRLAKHWTTNKWWLWKFKAAYIIFAGLEILDGRRSHIDGKEANHSTLVLSGFSSKGVNRNKTNFSIKVGRGTWLV